MINLKIGSKDMEVLGNKLSNQKKLLTKIVAKILFRYLKSKVEKISQKL